MRLEVASRGLLTLTPDQPDEVMDAEAVLERTFDAVLEGMFELDAIDPSVSGSIAHGDIELSVTVEAESFEQAMQMAYVLFRTALHAAGVGTKDFAKPEFLWQMDFKHMAVDDAELAAEDDGVYA